MCGTDLLGRDLDLPTNLGIYVYGGFRWSVQGEDEFGDHENLDIYLSNGYRRNFLKGGGGGTQGVGRRGDPGGGYF